MTKEKKKVLFVDDRKTQFETLDNAFKKYGFFELANKEPIFDEGSRYVLSREEQKQRILELFKQYEFDFVLFDLTLRNGREERLTPGMAKELLSVDIYNEIKEKFREVNKKFIFITSHPNWQDEQRFREIGGVVEGAPILRKPTEEGEKLEACEAYDDNGESRCGERFKNCDSVSCFNKRLRRMTLDE